MHSDGKTLRIGIFPTAPLQGQVTIAVQGMDPVVRSVDIDPGQPFTAEIALAAGVPASAAVAVTLTSNAGETLLSAQVQVQLR